MEIISLIIDIILLAGGILAMRYAYLVGGSIGHKSLEFMAAGFLVLGVAHVSETVLAYFFPSISFEAFELLHRVIVFVGFGLLLIGYRRLAQFARS